MTLAKGTRLGRYTILSPQGSDGMGEVYGARNSCSGMSPLKVLPAAIASTPLAPQVSGQEGLRPEIRGRHARIFPLQRVRV
jgi:hypothetical protein